MYYRALLCAIALYCSACSAPPAISVSCDRAPLSGDTNINCGDNDNNASDVSTPAPAPAPTEPPVTEPADAGTVVAARCSPGPLAGPWYRSDGAMSVFPNFVATGDGHEWVFPLDPGMVDGASVDVIVSQSGADAPLVAANIDVVAYDNANGWWHSHQEVGDVPSGEKHPLSIDVVDASGAETLRVVLQAPQGAPGADSSLWIWSAPIVRCP
jgi:hypothetical protein